MFRSSFSMSLARSSTGERRGAEIWLDFLGCYSPNAYPAPLPTLAGS